MPEHRVCQFRRLFVSSLPELALREPGPHVEGRPVEIVLGAILEAGLQMASRRASWRWETATSPRFV